MSRSEKKRLACFLALSVLVHILLGIVLSRLPARTSEPGRDPTLRVDLIEAPEPRADEKKLLARKPQLYDMMEVEEALSDVPASLSRTPGDRLRDAPVTPPPAPPVTDKQPDREPEPPKPERKPEPRTEVRRPPPKKDPARKPVEREVRREAGPAEDTEKRPEERVQDLPPLRELIPSISDLLAMRSRGGSLHRHDTVVQDGVGERQAKAAFDEYLAEFKSRVRLNWKVLDDPYMHESTTVLLIVINRDGTLGSVRKLQSSGMPGQDTQTLYAIRNSFPMRPPPDFLLDEEGFLTIHFSFHFLVKGTLSGDEMEAAGLLRRRPWRPDPTCPPPCIRW